MAGHWVYATTDLDPFASQDDANQSDMHNVNASCTNSLAHTHVLPSGYTWLHNATRTN